MSIGTYAQLQTAVGNWLNRSDLTSFIPDLIRLGEDRIYRRLRIRAMESSLSSAIASGVVAVPADYVEMKYAYINGTPVTWLDPKEPQWIIQNYPTRSSDGLPKFFAPDAGNFIFGPYPDSAYTMKGTYYKRLTALSDQNTTNWFTTNAPGVLLFAALCEAEVFIKNDPRLALWDAKYEQEISGIELEEKQARISGGPLSVSVSAR
jgi:hypothetical protein